jgi:hypothetical protein
MKSKRIQRRKFYLVSVLSFVLIGTLFSMWIYIGQVKWATYVNDRVPFTFDHPDSWRFEKKVEYSNLSLPPKPSLRVELKAFNKTDDKLVATLIYWDGPVVAVGHSCMGRDNKGCAYINNLLVESFYSTKPYDVWKSMKYSYTFTRYSKNDVNSEILNRILKTITIKDRTMLREDVNNRCTDGSTTLATRRLEERWVADDQVDAYLEQANRDHRCVFKEGNEEQS